VERINEAIPPDIIPPQPSTAQEQMKVKENAEDAADQEEEEELAVEGNEGNEEGITPEDGKDPAQEAEREEGVQDGMPGQLPAGDMIYQKIMLL